MTKMKFSKDMFYTNPNVPLYCAGKVYDVEDNMVARWLKRGGEIVSATPPKVEVPKPVVDSDTKEPVEPVDEKAEDNSKPMKTIKRK